MQGEQVPINRSWKDKRKLLLLLPLMLLCAFCFTSWLSYQVAYNSLKEQIETTHLPLTSDTVYSEIQQDLLRPIFISSLMAQDTFLRDWALEADPDAAPIIRYLSTIQQRYQTVTSFFVSASSSRYYHPDGVIKSLSIDDPDDAWFYRVSQLPPSQDYEINIDYDTADTSRTTVFVNYKVYDFNEKLIGVTGVGLSVDSVKKLIGHYQKNYQRSVYFIDPLGNLTLSDSGFTGPRNIKQRAGLAEQATLILSATEGRYSFNENGSQIYLNARYIPEFNWYLIVEQQDLPATAQLRQTLWINLFISLVVTLCSLIVANFTVGRYQRHLETLASTDKLTGMSNRQSFEGHLEQVIDIQHRANSPCSIIIFDIDHFKTVNDNYGHNVGDIALKQMSELTQKHIRQSDVICRWGGEEFIVLLPNCDALAALEVAEKIRLAVNHNELNINGHLITMTISCGIAQIKTHEVLASLLIDRADKAMYQAKQNGRNRSVIAE
ncbi:diguanylate cyclase [Agarivorans sp. DSG3-1]|uniref:sensor domain-containing diguanylate cyclase n=1 Tax=Agarivorans sp. DSG3-1 TaxID=3342249 RepID=UPI00398E9445